MKNIIAVGEEILLTDFESKNLEVIKNTAYSDILKNDLYDIILVSDKLGNGAYSSNGRNWIDILLPSYSSINICNNKFCLLSGSTIHISDFPFSWNTSYFTLAEGDFWNTICYGNLGFLAVSSLGVTASSINGISWTIGQIPSFNCIIDSHKAIFHENSYFVIGSITNLGDNIITYSSENLLTWNSTEITDLVYSNTKKLLIYDGYIYGLFHLNYMTTTAHTTVIMKSVDGILWDYEYGRGGGGAQLSSKILDFIFENNNTFPTMLIFGGGSYSYRDLYIGRLDPEESTITIKEVITPFIIGVGYVTDTLTNYTKIVEGFFPLFWSQFNLTSES